MNRSLIGGCIALAVLTTTGGVAQASKTVIKTKGMDASGTFEVKTPQACAGGVTALGSTSVQIDMFEATTTVNGSPSTVLQTSISVTRFDACNFVFSFGSGLFQGVGALSMNVLQSGKITGNFVLDDGTQLAVNLTLTGSDTTSLGVNSQHKVLGKTIVLQRAIGTTRTATLSGTVKVDNQTLSAAQPGASGLLARNTSGEVTILKP